MLRPSVVFYSGTDTAIGKKLADSLGKVIFSGRFTAALEEPVDLALVADAAKDVPAVLHRLAGRLRGLAVIFSEISPEELAGAALKAGVRVLGGHSVGIANPALGLNAILAPTAATRGRIALVSQSHALTRSVIDWAAPNGVGFSHIIGIGQNTEVGFGRILDIMARDAGTDLILLDIERLRDPRLFLSAARAASRLRPIIALAPGAGWTDPSFTALAAYKAALARSGVLLTVGFGEFLAIAKTLIRARPASGQDLAIIGNGFGCVRLAADAAVAAGIGLAPLNEDLRHAVKLALGPGLEIKAVTAVVDAPETKFTDLVSLFSSAPEIGGILIVHAPPLDHQDEASADALIACVRASTKPILVAVLGESTGAALRYRFADAGIAVFDSPEDAVKGFEDLLRNRQIRTVARELPPSTVVEIRPDTKLVHSIVRAPNRTGHGWMRQQQAFELLTAYGLSVLPTRVCDTADAAGAAASELGFPVVVKLLRKDFGAPRPVGSLAVDLPDAASARAAAAVIMARLRSRGEWAEDAQFVVQKQIHEASELQIRVIEEPTIGPTISFGPGGDAAGALSSMAVELPPLNMTLAHALIDRAGGTAMLRVLKGSAFADRTAVEATLVTISQIIIDCPEISVLEIDPLFASRSGTVVSNAHIYLRPAGQTRPRLAFRPYPGELINTVVLSRHRFVIRPIRPEDAEAHARMFARVPASDIRRRFFSTIRTLTPEQLIRLTEIDYTREMALIAVDQASGETVGVARIVCSDAEGTEGEFGVLVEPAAKRKGVGLALMRNLIAWARREGVNRVVGQVLTENIPMLTFVRHLGFSIRPIPGESDVVEAVLDLS